VVGIDGVGERRFVRMSFQWLESCDRRLLDVWEGRVGVGGVNCRCESDSGEELLVGVRRGGGGDGDGKRSGLVVSEVRGGREVLGTVDILVGVRGRGEGRVGRNGLTVKASSSAVAEDTHGLVERVCYRRTEGKHRLGGRHERDVVGEVGRDPSVASRMKRRPLRLMKKGFFHRLANIGARPPWCPQRRRRHRPLPLDRSSRCKRSSHRSIRLLSSRSCSGRRSNWNGMTERLLERVDLLRMSEQAGMVVRLLERRGSGRGDGGKRSGALSRFESKKGRGEEARPWRGFS
jgi:hypothetical protein